MQKEIENANQILQGRLIVGDHNSLLTYGNDVQVGLNDFSKSISNIVLRNNDTLEESICDVSNQIEHSQKNLKRKNGEFPISFERIKHYNIVRRYNEILNSIEKLELSFKLQQAQLIKDNKILDLLEEKLSNSIDNIGRLILEGKEVVGCKKPDKATMDKTDIENWYNRLEKKIEDFEISRVIANQSIIQIKMMKENNYLMIDRIISVLSTTIPLWRNQVSIILGLERVHENNQMQNILMDLTERQIERSKKLLSKSSGKKTDYERMKQLNDKLLVAIDEISEIEKKDNVIKQDFTKSLNL